MESEQAEHVESGTNHSQHSRRHSARVAVAVVIAVIVLGVGGYVLITKFIIPKNTTTTEKVLTVSDLENNSPDVHLTPETSDASVDNLTKELKAKIDKQIADKENPIKTVQTLMSVLCNTANASRPAQCVDYIKDFLANKMDTLRLTSDYYGQPDDLQVAQWRAEFYSQLVYAYRSMGQLSTGADGKSVDTTTEQLKYIGLYLEIAQNKANWGTPQTADDGHTYYFYSYDDVSEIIEFRNQLTTNNAGETTQ